LIGPNLVIFLQGVKKSMAPQISGDRIEKPQVIKAMKPDNNGLISPDHVPVG
jgi:hypothetical protein